MIRCNGEREGERCHRYNRVIVLKGGVRDPNQTYTCDGCGRGEKPYVPRSSARKGQQKQVKK